MIQPTDRSTPLNITDKPAVCCDVPNRTGENIGAFEVYTSPFGLGVEAHFANKDSATLYADAHNTYRKDLLLPSEMAAEIDRLRTLVEDLKKDKQRLDYLDQANARLNAQYKTDYRWELIMNHNVNRLMLPGLSVDLNDARANGLPSCRDAIDQRMQQSASHITS